MNNLFTELKRELREKGGFALAVEAFAMIGFMAICYVAVVLIGAVL